MSGLSVKVPGIFFGLSEVILLLLHLSGSVSEVFLLLLQIFLACRALFC